MTTDPSATSSSPATAPPLRQHGAVGSAVRLAVLDHLATRPGGVPFDALHLVIQQAARLQITETQARHVLYALRDDGRIACEATGQYARAWFSPAARQAAAARQGWRPGIDTHADAAAHQAAGAIARARGLATDPSDD